MQADRCGRVSHSAFLKCIQTCDKLELLVISKLSKKYRGLFEINWSFIYDFENEELQPTYFIVNQRSFRALICILLHLDELLFRFAL